MKKIILTLLCLLMFGMGNAQNDSTTLGRKRVAVVLSGGGAKGMAHIGVLKVLERAGIPIDIVTGTSMGSIVGGLYAIGYNAHALDSMVRVQDWGYVITDKEDLRNQSLGDRRKQSTFFFTTGMSIGKNDKNAGGLIKGKNLAELFQQLCTGYSDSLDFTHDLPIPFACVATDIIDNEEVDFHSGRLPQAMRASMAIPAAFSPVRIGDMVLVDGGLKNNYPADIARKMGADIIIGVTVQGQPKNADDLNSPMSILSQIIDVNCKNKYDENLAITDLHLQVDTKGYGSASFSQAAIDTLIRRGEEVAMRNWDKILALKHRIGVDQSFRPKILQPLVPQVMTEKQRVKGFYFENMTPQAERFLRNKFQLNRIDSIDAKLAQQLTTSMRVDLFYQTAECRFIYDDLIIKKREELAHGNEKETIPTVSDEGTPTDSCSVTPSENGVRVILSAGNRKSVQLYAGMRYDTEDYAAVQLALDIPLKTAIPISNELTLRLGKRLMIHDEITVHPRNFTRPTFGYTFRRNDVDVYIDGDLDYNIRYNQYQAEFLPINFTLRHFDLKMGLRWDYMHYRSKLGSESAKQMTLKNEHFFSYRARLTYNNEDNWYFPMRGVRFNAEYAYVTNNFAKLNERGADGNKIGKKAGMSEIRADWRRSFTFGKRFTLQPMFYGRLLFGSIVPPIFGNTIGGNYFGHYVEQQMPFAGIGEMEYVDQHFVAAQLQAQYRITDNNYVQFRMVGAQQAEEAKHLLDTHTLLGAQAAYYYNTLFGPVGATLGYSNRTKKPYFFLNLGYEF